MKKSKSCSIIGCTLTNYYAKGLCSYHYYRQLNKKDITTLKSPIYTKQDKCLLCDKLQFCGGYCKMHYHRKWKNGEFGGVEPLRQKQPEFCIDNDIKGNICLEIPYAAGYCSYHYYINYRKK